MTPAEINKTAPPIYYIGGAVVIDKIISKTNHMQISFLVSSCFSFCFPAATCSWKHQAMWLLR